MGYDIEFFARPGKEQVGRRRFLAGLELVGWRDGDEGLLTHESEATGVSATVEDGEPSEFEGWRSLGLFLSLAYLRPSFWGLEVLPEVARAAVGAGLAIADPQSQDPNDDGGPRVRDGESLIRSWNAGNEMAIGAAGSGMPRLSRESAHYWWRYQRFKDAMQDRLAQSDVFVPSLGLVCRGRGKDVLLQIAWPDCIPLVLPRCDLVLVGHSKRSGFAVDGVASYDEVRQALSPHLGSIEVGRGLVAEILLPDAAKRVGGSLPGLHLEPRAVFSQVGADAFVDV